MKLLSTHNQGFTLLEVMLVVVVIGVMAALAGLAIGGNQERKFQQEVVRLQQLINHANDQVLFQQQTWGLEFIDNGYRFLQLDTHQLNWNEVTKTPFAAHTLEQDLEFTLSTGDNTQAQFDSTTSNEEKHNGNQIASNLEAVLREERKDKSNTDNDQSPQIVLLPNGELSSFRLLLQLTSAPNVRHALSSDGFSRVIHQVNPRDD